MATIAQVNGQQLTDGLQCLSLQEQSEPMSVSKSKEKESQHQVGCGSSNNHHGVCAICLNKIQLQETALVKGCEHAYCVTCILRWASYKKEPTCPQCKYPFEFLHIHRSLNGSIQDYMHEESVCLLLRASWFKPLIVEEREEVEDDAEDFYLYQDEDEDLNEAYLGRSSSIWIGNRRWGDTGYVRTGRQEARPVYQPNFRDSGAGPSRQPRKKEASKENVGRRAKRALKREAADKAAAAAAAARSGRT